MIWAAGTFRQVPGLLTLSTDSTDRQYHLSLFFPGKFLSAMVPLTVGVSWQ